METLEPTGTQPEFVLRHRMALALEVSEVSVQEIADALSVNRNTVSGWLSGRHNPSTATLLFWASQTGVDYRWLVENPTVGGQAGNKPAGRRQVTDNNKYSKERTRSSKRPSHSAGNSHSYPHNPETTVATAVAVQCSRNRHLRSSYRRLRLALNAPGLERKVRQW